VGLAKNTGKTVALAQLLRELEAQGRRAGVTSVGRDGEERDAIDSRIEKPRIQLAGGTLVATTDALLRASAIPSDLLERTGVRTPLGEVLIARLRGPGAIEVAGPSASEQVRAVSDSMLAHGAEQVLIDGAIDRRAASSPGVADALILSTGAVLSQDISELVDRTSKAVELLRLPAPETAANTIALHPRFTLTAEVEQIAELLDANPTTQSLLVPGSLPDGFMRALAHVAGRRRRELVLTVADPTKVFLFEHGLSWYARRGIRLRARDKVELVAITVNPVAPRSHSFDSAQLRVRLEEAIPDVAIFDVLDGSYTDREPAGLA
jgi:hypothetical protein